MAEKLTRKELHTATEMLFSDDTATLLARDYAIRNGRNRKDFNRMKKAIQTQQLVAGLYIIGGAALALLEVVKVGLSIRRFVKKKR